MLIKIGRFEIGARIDKAAMVPNLEREQLAIQANSLSSGHPRAMSVKNALQSSLNWSFACLDAISMRSSAIPFNLGFKTKVQGEDVVRPVTEHSFIDLWAKPNQLFSSWQMQYLLYSHINSAGVAFWLMVRNQNTGRPDAVWPLEPHRVEKVINPDLT